MILQGLRDSFRDKVEFHNSCIKQLGKQIKILQDRLDQTYLDKLDKKISEDFWQTQTKKWLDEKERTSNIIKCLKHKPEFINQLETYKEAQNG